MTQRRADLSGAEERTLRHLEAEVSKQIGCYNAVAMALQDIERGQLYRETHGTMSAYLRQRWRIGDTPPMQRALEALASLSPQERKALLSESEAVQLARRLKRRKRHRPEPEAFARRCRQLGAQTRRPRFRGVPLAEGAAVVSELLRSMPRDLVEAAIRDAWVDVP